MVPLIDEIPGKALLIASNIQDELDVARQAKDVAAVRPALDNIERHIGRLIDAAKAAQHEREEADADRT